MSQLPRSRLDSLYKDFRPLKELNPDGYAANISTWTEYMKMRYLQNSSLFYCGSELLQQLSKDIYGYPKSLDVVIDMLVEEGYLVSSDDFYGRRMYSREYPTLIQWMGFGKSRFFKSRRSDTGLYLKDLQLIVKPSIENKFKRINEKINDNVIEKATSVTDLVLPLKEFYEKSCFFEYVKEEEKEVMLFYLANYKGKILMEDTFIKVIEASKSDNYITENDRRIADLKNILSNIGGQVDKMKIERSDYSKMLNKSVEEAAPREAQRRYLQARNLAEKYLYRLLDYQSTLQEIKVQIEMAVTNEVIVGTLSEANRTMKSIRQYSLSVDKVEHILDELKDHREQNEEISRMLVGSDETIDESELDAELERMDKQVEQTKKQTETKQKENSDVLDQFSRLRIGEQTSDEDANSKETTEANTRQRQLVSEH